MVPRVIPELVEYDDAPHFKLCTLGYASACGECEKIINANDERHVAFTYSEWTKSVNATRIREVTGILIKCGKCMSEYARLHKIEKDTKETRLEPYKSCALPRKPASKATRVYLQPAQAPDG